MSFCGSKNRARSVAEGVVKNECFVDVLNIVPHAIFVLVSLFILIVWCKSKYYNATSWVHFRGHNVRWFFSLVLIVIIVTEIAEGFMSDARDPDTVNYHVFIPPIIALVATILSLVFYHNIEQWNSPRFLLIILAYWMSVLPIKILKGVSLYKNGTSIVHVRVWLTWIDVALYMILLTVEINLLRVQKYAFFKNPVPTKIPPELGGSKFVFKHVNFLSKVTFWWLNGFLADGYKTPYEQEHLGQLPKDIQTESVYKRFKAVFEDELEKCKRSGKKLNFHKVYLKVFWRNLCLAGILRFFGDIVQFVGPWCIELIINYAYAQVKLRESTNPTNGSLTYSGVSNVSQAVVVYNSSSAVSLGNFSVTMATPQNTDIHNYVTAGEFFSNGFILAGVLLVLTLLQNSLWQQHHHLVIVEAAKFRVTIQAMVYNKGLHISGLVINSGKMTMGQILNHMSQDATNMMLLFFFIHYVWSVPLTVIIGLVLMYMKMGWTALIGGSVVVMSGPLQYFVGKGMSNMQKKVMAQSDKRVKKCNEAIQGIKVIKLLAWEYFFRQDIEASRKMELKRLFANCIFRILFTFILIAVPTIGTVVTFVLYPSLEESPLNVGKALSTLALFNILTIPMALFTYFITTFITARVSMKRLVNFLLAEENEGLADQPKTLTHSIGIDTEDIKMDTIVEYRNGTKKTSTSLQKDDDLSSSQSSLGSNLSRTPDHSRHNSKGSLPEMMEGSRRSSSQTAYTGAALTVNDGKDSQRRRHTSGVSTEDEEEVAENVTVMEAKNVFEICDGEFSWHLNKEDESALKNINVKIPVGKLTMIVGQVGAGKTSLVSAILGEMTTISGHVEITKGVRIAFVPQKPWLLNATLKDNILFGEPYNHRRYTKVIHSCALQPDIATLPAGDQTEIGEKGINLSGGQKQRISIARALYSKADTVILDDPLSALDAHVGKHVFEDAIVKCLVRRKRSVILVTHQLQYISHSNYLIAMKDGMVQYQGKLSEVKKQEPELYESWRKALREAKASESSRDHHEEPRSPDRSSPFDYSRQISTQSILSGGSQLFSRQMSEMSNMEEECLDFSEKDPLKQDDKKIDGELVKKEHKEVGAVSLRVYGQYVAACGGLFICFMMMLQVGYHVLLAWSNIVLSQWAEDSTEFQTKLSNLSNVGSANETSNVTLKFDNDIYMHKYLLLNIVGLLGAFIANLVLYLTTLRASKNLHFRLLDTILHVPIRFFDTNPSGRIMNRFSADVAGIDQRLPFILESFIRCVMVTVSALAVNAIGTPYFLIAVLPLTILYYCLQFFFRATARELQRIESVTKSPVFSHLSETLSGLQTIRAFRAEKRFKKRAFTLIDNNNIPYIFVMSINRWLGIRLDYIGSLLVFISAVSSLATCLAGHTTPAYVGLSLTYALQVSIYLNWIVRNAAEMELTMNSVERVDEFIHLKREVNTHHKGHHELEKDWPNHGKIEFKNVSLKYDTHLDKVLNDACFTINPGEKVGICGRTGSGKSSLTLSLFRMIDICEGEIYIDEKDTKRVPLEELRSKLAIIPQDPVLFTGTVRYNLDPQGEIPDEKLWAALETVQLKESIAELPDKLDANVSEGGENFSVGQKQLFCLARAFLRDNKVLVLDEATASIDLETDNKLQRVISTAFGGKTVITIAHRISTILKYDRVMVLEKGTVKEFDSPQSLLRDSNSIFTSLVHSSKK
ncbi:ATP-binding cassette sub-family C member 8-like isoform X2 [Ostrea edulis]|uniref:ATP-binding cassette sub-family C member 8-like isoform X2 n=1 Tax=Ostrea edulis TaxID=37623 RepID=UPI0024AFE34D|nr:ATP-binding cassette sub-family C member 8-like isoform X2 [Ostrea edulis]